MKAFKILLGFIIPAIILIGTLYLSFDLQKIEERKKTGWLKLEEVSPISVGAVIVTEDWAFYEHAGLDFNQLGIAISDFLMGREKLRGASTITQQVAKNIFLSEERSFLRKFLELIATLKLENNLTKREILEAYLNVAEFYPDTSGIRIGSEKLFSSPALELNALESAYLAMMLPNPKFFSVNPSRIRMEKILEKMRMGKVITREEYDVNIRRLPQWRHWKD